MSARDLALANEDYQLAKTLDWMRRSACRPEHQTIFFPERHGGVEVARQARSICRDCPVRIPCLNYALIHSIKEGVWGGKTEKERRQMRRISARREVM